MFEESSERGIDAEMDLAVQMREQFLKNLVILILWSKSGFLVVRFERGVGGFGEE